MGVVLRGVQESLDRAVAVKLLPVSAMSTEAGVERFFREARAVARISHANVVQVHDCGREGENAFIVMELIQGESLGAKLKRDKKIAAEAAAAICAGAARGLAAAHERGLIHRDVKPDNLLLSYDGTAKLVDFGLTKDLAESTDLTKEGTLLGTPTYMSPEACEGEPCEAPSDLYSLGAMLFHAIAGRPPFTAPTIPSLLLAHVAKPAPRLKSVTPDAPPVLDDLVARLLAKKPGERWASALEVADILEGIARAAGLGVGSASSFAPKAAAFAKAPASVKIVAPPKPQAPAPPAAPPAPPGGLKTRPAPVSTPPPAAPPPPAATPPPAQARVPEVATIHRATPPPSSKAPAPAATPVPPRPAAPTPAPASTPPPPPLAAPTPQATPLPAPSLSAKDLMARAKVRLAARDDKGAERDLEDVVSLTPGDAMAHFALACLLARRRQFARALDHLELAVGAGFKDREKILRSDDLKPLAVEARFRAAVNGLTAKPGA